MFRGIKMVGGVMMISSTGLSPLRNPSERSKTMVRYFATSKLRLSIYLLADKIAAILGSGRLIELHILLCAIKDSGNALYTGSPDYKNIRICRSLVSMFQLQFADTEADWFLWRAMSPSVKSKLLSRGIWTFPSAVRFRNAMRVKLSDPQYGFADLMCYICLLFGMSDYE
jgi:hypothetical protein